MTLLIALPIALIVATVFFRVVERPAHLLAKRVRDGARDDVPSSFGGVAGAAGVAPGAAGADADAPGAAEQVVGEQSRP
jgi:peptidoglycan/LPS O-acetylase OafA/YrhL